MLLDTRLVVMRAMEYKCCTWPVITPISKKTIYVKWIPPTSGLYKLNTDGSFLDKQHIDGVRGVIRNSNGDWILGYSKKLYAHNHTHTELITLEQGLQIVVAHHLTLIEIETDSIEAIEFLEQKILLIKVLLTLASTT